MKYALDSLKSGNVRLAQAFADADARWKSLFADVKYVDDSELARRLTQVQHEIEGIFGERNLGKDCMPWSALSHFYDVKNGFKRGHQEAAEKVARAFARSSCSLEVKFAAKAAASFYGLDVQTGLQ